MKVSFQTFIGIDYSGAQHAQAGLPGLRVFKSHCESLLPQEIRPQANAAKVHWSRASLSAWLVDQLRVEKNAPVLIGIDHAFSFPLEYFEQYGIAFAWDSFLDDFCLHWPTDAEHTTVLQILQQQRQLPVTQARLGNARWRRLAERNSTRAKSVFHFSVPGAVASSTHAGLPWLRYLRRHPELRNRLHFWPFDGWIPAPGKSVPAEIYPALWNRDEPRGELSQDQLDAKVVCAALRAATAQEQLHKWFSPDAWDRIRLTEKEKQQAQWEGWILGLT